MRQKRAELQDAAGPEFARLVTRRVQRRRTRRRQRRRNATNWLGIIAIVRVGRESRFALEPKAIIDAQTYLDHVSRQWDMLVMVFRTASVPLAQKS